MDAPGPAMPGLGIIMTQMRPSSMTATIWREAFGVP